MGLKKKLQVEVEEYCACASTHGLGYLFRFSLMERLFWFTATTTMLVLGSVLINQMRVDWEDNPTLLRADPSRHPIDTVPLPSITVCNNFTPDKWGFLRRLLNQVKFQCNSDDECKETLAVRNFFKTQFLVTSSRFDNNSLDYFIYQFSNLSQTLIETNLEKAMAGDKLDKFDTDGESVDMDNLFIHISRSLASPHSAYVAQEAKAKLLGMLTQKLQGRRNNYGFQRDLAMTPFFWGKQFDMIADVIRYIPNIVLGALVLHLSGPGQFGSFFFNYAQDVEKGDASSLLRAWNNPAHRRETYDHLEMLDLYEDIFNGVFNSNANVSIADIAPIFTPAENFIDSRRYSLMFRHTVFTQARQSNELSGDLYTYLNAIPKFLTKKNYFGRLLSSNLMQLMEVMYHSTLRAGRFRDDWMHHPRLYPRGLKKLLPFPLINSTLFYPKVEDFNRGSLSYSPIFVFGEAFRQDFLDEHVDDEPEIYFQFDQKTPITFANDSARNEANQILDDLRHKYQHQQMILFCQDSFGTSCEDQFRPVLTDRGICYAINTPRMSEVIKSSTYMDLFTSVFADQVKSGTTAPNLTTGYTINLILDSHQSAIFDYEPGTFWIGINQQMDFMAVKEHGIQAQPGMHTHIQITPEIIEPTDRFKDPSIETRQCRFVHEVQDKVSSAFKNYTFKSCEFECKLAHSRSRCGCTPWNYPYLDEAMAEVCDGVQAFCFEQAMGGDYDKDECSCFQNCQEFVYVTTSHQHKIDPNTECDLRANWKSMVFEVPFGRRDSLIKPTRYMATRKSNYNLPILIGEKLRHLDGAEQKFWLLKLMSDKFADEAHKLLTLNRFLKYVSPDVVGDHCVDMVSMDLAFVTITVPGSLASKVVRDIRFSFTDKVSALGGTVGLFTGMSLLSLVEAVFWLARMVTIPMRSSD